MTKQTEAIELVLKHAAPSFLSPGWTLVRSEDLAALQDALAAQPAQQDQIPTVYLYRHPDGLTQVMAPTINDPALVMDMLKEGVRAMAQGQPVTRN